MAKLLCLLLFAASQSFAATYRGRDIPDPLLFGQPQPTNGNNHGRILKRLAYEAYYSPELMVSLWVAYAYRDTGLKAPRREKFKEDPEWRGEPGVFPALDFYKGSYKIDRNYVMTGFDKGHQAPDSSVKVYGKKAQDESYYLSNMTPQYSVTNQGIWREWEDRIRKWATKQDPVWVTTGPIFYPDRPVVKIPKRKPKVAVPHAYYAIVVRGKAESPEMLAFIAENSLERKSWSRDAASQLTPVAAVEALTGFNFNPDLPAALQRLERQTAQLWQH